MIDFRQLKIRGYAVTFTQAIEVDGGYECISRSAFDAWLGNRGRAYLNIGEHEAEAVGDIDCLFVDNFGLGFEATIDCSVRGSSGIPELLVRGCDAASICFRAKASREIALDGRPVREITQASVEHITITSHPAYPGTAVWFAGADLQNAPWRVRTLATRWRLSRNAHALAQGQRTRDEDRRAADGSAYRVAALAAHESSLRRLGAASAIAALRPPDRFRMRAALRLLGQDVTI